MKRHSETQTKSPQAYDASVLVKTYDGPPLDILVDQVQWNPGIIGGLLE